MSNDKKGKKVSHVSKIKIETVKELAALIKTKKTMLLASIKDLPSAKFQEICKKLREKAVVKVPKKNILFKAVDASANKELEKIKEYVKNSPAILFSDMDAFDLSVELLKNKSPTKAKTGQEANDDIEVQAGPTELIPGPAISELGALGIQIQIEKGKINIREAKVIVKKGQKISANAADVMSKLDIKPFLVGFTPLCAFDMKENKFYTEIRIDREATLKELKNSFARALPFAVKIGYISNDTIGLLIGKAAMQAKRINRIMTGEPEEVAPMPAMPSEESSNEKPKEEKHEAAAEGLSALFG